MYNLAISQSSFREFLDEKYSHTIEKLKTLEYSITNERETIYSISKDKYSF